MKLLLLFVLGCVPAVVFGNVCKVVETDCTKCLSIKGCAFFVIKEKGSCHKLSEKFGKLRFKATKKSQCKTVASLLDRKVEFERGNETIIISNPVNESIEQKKETKIVLEATRPDEASQSTNDAASVLQSPNSGGDGIELINSGAHEFNSDPASYNENTPVLKSNKQPVLIGDAASDNETAPNSAAVHVLSSDGNAPTINNEAIRMQLFQYRENQLTSIYFDCSKENRLLKRVENSICTSFRLLTRARQLNWIVDADVTGVEYDMAICSFLKAEKLYCKSSP